MMTWNESGNVCSCPTYAYHPSKCLEPPKNTIKIYLSKDSWTDVNSGPTKHKAAVEHKDKSNYAVYALQKSRRDKFK
jgi:hypothetical protein